MFCEGASLYQQGNCPQNVDNYGSLCSQTPEMNDCVLGNSDPKCRRFGQICCPSPCGTSCTTSLLN
ncbi:hypothetical protein Avbf_12748 [Armadillidium vulgare]|nr:hypothetical protein Avbf_12748 [Armadillidium vulgare]